MNKISNSKLELWTTCGLKFRFRYIDNLKGNYTSTPLLFGTAIDNALNHILESIRDKKPWTKEEVLNIFHTKMCEWNGENRLDFFKNEAPDELKDSIDPENADHQELVWENIYKRGIACIDVYINEILPQFDEVISVQTPVEIGNGDGDSLVGVVDFIVKMKDGRVVLMDNKTSSAKYPKNKVVKSQQLSLYLEQFPEIRYAGYCVVIKNPEREKGLTHQILIDEIPEETRADAFKRLEQALLDIKNKKFEPNYKSCMAFGKPCEFARLCKYNDPTGLVPAREKK